MKRTRKAYRVLTFHTTDAAMEMEAFCRDSGIPGRLTPVPRQLSAGCGIAWRMEAAVPGGPSAAGKIAVIVCIAVLFVIAGTNLRRKKAAR